MTVEVDTKYSQLFYHNLRRCTIVEFQYHEVKLCKWKLSDNFWRIELFLNLQCKNYLFLLTAVTRVWKGFYVQPKIFSFPFSPQAILFSITVQLCNHWAQLSGRLFSPSVIYSFLLHFPIDMGSYDNHAKYRGVFP